MILLVLLLLLLLLLLACLPACLLELLCSPCPAGSVAKASALGVVIKCTPCPGEAALCQQSITVQCSKPTLSSGCAS
jgi:hypothetical protein